MIKLNPHCSVRPTIPEEFSSVIQYFLNSSPADLKKRGTDANKLPSFEDWYSYMLVEHEKPLKQKQFFCLSWHYDSQLIGHSCVDHVEFGTQAFAHLHIWEPEFRHKKLGYSFFWLSLRYYFKHFDLKRIYCQPNANNNEPNQLLKGLGFKLIKYYKTIPHPICFEQYVNLYVLEAPEGQ
jgi:RimJ/RimL family protein N-acetyltransferase